MAVWLLSLTPWSGASQPVRSITGYSTTPDATTPVLYEKQIFNRRNQLEFLQEDPFCTTTFTYSASGRLQKRERWCYESDANGTTTYSYNEGEVCSTGDLVVYRTEACTYQWPDGREKAFLEYTFDQDGRLRTRDSVTFFYDEKERLIRKEEHHQEGKKG